MKTIYAPSQPQNRSRASKAHDILMDQISNGELAPGTPLVEQALCEQLNMSRTPIREALARLRSEGLVEHYPSKGSFVAPITKEKVKQTYEAIEAVESMLFYLLAEDHSHPAFARAGKAMEEMEAAATGEDWKAWVVADESFHKYSRLSCKNTYIAEQCDLLSRPAQQYRMLITKNAVDKTVSTRDHRLTYEAVLRGDAVAAREAAFRHYAWLRGQIIDFLDKYSLY